MTTGRHYHKRPEDRITSTDPQSLKKALGRHLSFPDHLGALADHARSILQAEGLPTGLDMYQTADGWTDAPGDAPVIGAANIDRYVVGILGRDAGSAVGLAARVLSISKRMENPSIRDAYTLGRLAERLIATEHYDSQTGAGNAKRSKAKAAKRQQVIEIYYYDIENRSTIERHYTLAAMIIEKWLKKWPKGPKPPGRGTIVGYLREEGLIS